MKEFEITLKSGTKISVSEDVGEIILDKFLAIMKKGTMTQVHYEYFTDIESKKILFFINLSDISVISKL